MLTLPAMPDVPWSNAAELARSPFGVSIDKPGRTSTSDETEVVEKENRKGIRGDGIFGKKNARIRNSRILNCYVGARLSDSDSNISGTWLSSNRDVGLWINNGAGNCSSINNHAYGAQIALYNDGGDIFSDSCSTWADCWVGALCKGLTTITGSKFQFCENRSVVFRGGWSSIVNCTLNVPKAVMGGDQFTNDGQVYKGCGGFQFDGDFASMIGGSIQFKDETQGNNPVSGLPSFGGIINANGCKVLDVNCNCNNMPGAIAYQVWGNRRNVVIRSDIQNLPADGLALVVNDPAQLNIRIGIDGIGKPISQYVKLPSGWGGSVKLIDTMDGTVIKLPPSKATGGKP